MFADELAARRGAVVDRWIESVINAYPEETATFLKEQPNRFANPVGASLREGLALIVDGVIAGSDPEELRQALDLVIRVRAVQEFKPPAALGFVFDLKTIVRDVVADGSEVPKAFDDSVDRLGLVAFDVYMSCREQLWSIRAKEIRNQSLGILERMQEWREKRARESETASK
ncbi:MAG: RsbRD N-terminal domain-containing protein [Acidobacteriota bacterium]|nr:RsbRD N-terminal domain-containing protein [Acidobacteriota bacterium]